MSVLTKIFVVALVAISTLGWVITTAIRARHGYPIEGEWGGLTNRHGADEATKSLTVENEQLKTKVGMLEERLKVLERIATDPSHQLAEEIERLK